MGHHYLLKGSLGKPARQSKQDRKETKKQSKENGETNHEKEQRTNKQQTKSLNPSTYDLHVVNHILVGPGAQISRNKKNKKTETREEPKKDTE